MSQSESEPSGTVDPESKLNQSVGLKHFGGYSIAVGILLIIVGSTGIFLPEFMSLETDIFIALLFITGGAFWVLHAIKYDRKNWSGWFKPVLLLVSGLLMLIYPMGGIAAVGLLLAIYLLLDSYGSFSLAYSLHPDKGWGWMAFNGVVSLLLALFFLAGWPITSFFLVGLYVSISLLFDGWALLLVGWSQRKSR